MKKGFYQVTTPTKEQLEISQASEAFLAAKKDHSLVMKAVFFFYIIGLPLFIVGSGSLETVGLIGLSFALIFFVISFPLSLRMARLDFEGEQLVNAYNRKNSKPFYDELVQKFADEPHIKVTMAENGMIALTDERSQNAPTER